MAFSLRMARGAPFSAPAARVAMAAASLIAMTVLATACGPSLRMVHQSDTYFERCYAADLDPDLGRARKHGCWQRWLASYSRDQTVSHIRYAQARERALRETVSPPPSAALPDAQVSANSSSACAEVCRLPRDACIARCGEEARDCLRTCDVDRSICLGGCP